MRARFGPVIVGLFTDLLGVGGVQTAGRSTAAALSKIAEEHGCGYCFFSLNDPSGAHELVVGGRRFLFRGFGRSKARFVFAVLPWITRKPRLLLAAHPHLAPPAAILKATSPSMAFLVMTHGIEVWHRLRGLRREALARADLVLAPSADTARRLIAAQGLPEGKVKRLAWGLDPDFLESVESAASLPPPAGLPDGRFVLAVGRWSAAERYKGADHLIRAFARVAEESPEVRLVFVGDGDDVPRLRQLAAELAISERVHFLGKPAKEQLVSCYQRAELFALPSGGEGFGFVFLEAMALGKPVIGAAQGGCTDLIADGETGLLVPYGDSTSLAAAIRRLLTDPSLRRRLGQSARERVLSEYCFERFEAELSAIFRNGLER